MNDQATGSHPTALGVLENGAEATLPSNYGSIVRAPRNLVSPSPSGQGVVLGPNLGRVATSLGMERSDRWHRMTPLLPCARTTFFSTGVAFWPERGCYSHCRALRRS